MTTKLIAIATILTVAMLAGIIATTPITAYADESETDAYCGATATATSSGDAVVINDIGCTDAP